MLSPAAVHAQPANSSSIRPTRHPAGSFYGSQAAVRVVRLRGERVDLADDVSLEAAHGSHSCWGLFGASVDVCAGAGIVTYADEGTGV